MPSILTAVFKAAIGLLVNKGRDKKAEKLNGDITDKKFHGLIVCEIEDVKQKVDGLSTKELQASISLFKEGIELLYVVFHSARSRSEDGVVTSLACAEKFSFAKGKTPSEVIELDELATRALFIAKERFKESRGEATAAFYNETLSTPYCILAMQFRVMATILETVDNPGDAAEPCKVCIEELNSLSAVQNGFNVQLKKGLGAVKALFNKDERRKIISSVCHVNRVVYDVTLTVGKDVSFWNWPTVDTGEEKVDPLRDGRVTTFLRKKGMEHCCVTPRSFGQEGEKEHKLKLPLSIATNHRGHIIVGDDDDGNIKVFDGIGTFMKLFIIPNDDVDTPRGIRTKLNVLDVAMDTNDNIYVLVRGAVRHERHVYVLNNTADLQHKFPVRGKAWGGLTVADSGKVLVLGGDDVADVIDVYEPDGQFVRAFGKGKWSNACDITAASDGCVVIVDWKGACVHIFSENGDYLNKLKLQRCYSFPRIAFHRASEHVVVACKKGEKDLLYVEIYTKDCEFVHSAQIHARELKTVDFIHGVTVTTEGRIAVSCGSLETGKVIVI